MVGRCFITSDDYVMNSIGSSVQYMLYIYKLSYFSFLKNSLAYVSIKNVKLSHCGATTTWHLMIALYFFLNISPR